MANKTQTIINQFVISDIVNVPCDSVFANLLPQLCTITRPYDASEGVKKVNEYGEVIMTHSVAQIIGTDVPVRAESISQRGKTGFVIEVQGGEVRATYRFFFCPEVDIKDNDVVVMGAREYQTILVSPFYDASELHHKEVLLRRIDNL